MPRIIKVSEYLSILYSKALRQFRKPKFTIGDNVRILKYRLHIRKAKKLQLTKRFLKLLHFFPGNLHPT